MNYEIYDVHQHLKLQPNHTPADLKKDHELRVALMDKNGISKAAVSPSSQFDITHGIDDVRRVNDLVAEYVARYSDRFPIGLGFVDLRMRETINPETERIMKTLGLRGVCWHHMSLGLPINHESTSLCLEQLRVLGGIAMIHCHGESMYESAWRLDSVAEDFPDVTIVVLSGLYGWSKNDETLWVAGRHQNLCVDTVFFPVNHWIERTVRELGIRRTLYGSDLMAIPVEASFHKASSLYEIEASPHLSREDKQRVFRDNMKELFKLE